MKKPFDPYAWASATCAARECCGSEIASKLCRKGVTRAEAEAVVERLTDEGFIDEERYVRAYVSDKFRFDRWGRIKIRHALRHLNLPEQLVEQALAEISEEDYRTVLADFLAARNRTVKADDDYERYRKLATAALNRGFEPAAVRAELERQLRGLPDE